MKKNKNNRSLSKKTISGTKKFFVFFVSFMITEILGGIFLLYGPLPKLRNRLITTMNQPYLATIFYDDETIQKILEKNKEMEPKEDKNISKLIHQ